MVSPEHVAGPARGLPAARDARLAGPMLAGSVLAVAVVDAALITRGHVVAGGIADGVLLFVLLNYTTWRRSSADPFDSAAISALRALALVPLARVIAVGMPVSRASAPLAETMVLVAVGYAALRFAPLVGVSVRALVGARVPRVPWRPSRTDATVMTAGGVLGLVAYLLGAPSLVPAHPSVGRTLLAFAAVTLTALVEELVFRGLLQTTFQRVDARAGFLAATALFACGYLAAGGTGLVLALALAGVAFAYGFALSGDLRAAIVGHWELAFGACVVWPVLFGRTHSAWLEGTASTAVLAVLVAAGVAAAWKQLGAGARIRRAGPGATER